MNTSEVEYEIVSFWAKVLDQNDGFCRYFSCPISLSELCFDAFKSCKAVPLQHVINYHKWAFLSFEKLRKNTTTFSCTAESLHS